ncbi:MAG: hypothetical protein PHV34_23870 [Verrucomicrobiae bacterium]|nr:hypothetical protein [Verrucomicrobiae bacterium]
MKSQGNNDEWVRKVVGQGGNRLPPLRALYQLYQLIKKVNPHAVRNSTDRVRRFVGHAR